MSYPEKVKQRAIELTKDGYSPGAIISTLTREFPPEDIPLDERTIRRWRREQKLELSEKEILPIDDRRREEHFEHLLNIVHLLLENEVGKVFGNPSISGEPEADDYTIISEESDFEKISHSHLVEKIENNIEYVCKTYSVWDFWDCFVPHLMAESPEYQDFERLYNDHTIEFINILRMLVQRKTFKGTCPVCIDWY